MDEFDNWFEAQDETVKSLIQERFSRLENTVKATRQERDTLSRELKELSKKMDSESQQKLSELQAQLEATERKAIFFQEAYKQGVSNTHAAYSIFTAENLWDESGKPDWKRLREIAPEFFKSGLSTNAGSGTAVKVMEDANQAIRQALKRK
jgi:exonuclease VII large subunit